MPTLGAVGRVAAAECVTTDNAFESASFGNACNLFTSAMAAVPSMLCNERLIQRFTFYIDSEQNKACSLHVAQRPLTKGVLFAPVARMFLAT